MSIARHREIRLTASIRTGESVRRGHFDLVETVIPEPGPGQVLVRNRWMAVTAAMRTLMGDVPVPLPMYRAGEVMHGSALGEVVRSDAPALAPGDWVVHGSGWREFAAGEAAAMRRIAPITTAEQAVLHLGQGLTAYVGLRAAAPVRQGDTVFVSGAGGAIGSIAGQLGRLLGAARVVGSVGSPDKAAHLVERLGFDAAFDRHDGPVDDRLRAAAPDGVDVVFDTVGGEQLTAAVRAARPGARIALCGALAHQLGGADPGVELDVMTLIGRRIGLRGFTASDHPGLRAEWESDAARWLRDGALVLAYTEADGLANAPEALLDLLAGHQLGAVIVRV